MSFNIKRHIYTSVISWRRTRRLCADCNRFFLREALLYNPSHDSAWPTLKSKQQTWTKQSFSQRYVCVGCELNSDQALRLLCLKGEVRARGSMLWRHHWQEASEFLCTITPLFWSFEIDQQNRKCSFRRTINVTLSVDFKLRFARFKWMIESK